MDMCKKYLNSDIYLNKSMSAYKKFLKLLCLLISVWESSLIFPNTWKYKKQHKYNQNLITPLIINKNVIYDTCNESLFQCFF